MESSSSITICILILLHAPLVLAHSTVDVYLVPPFRAVIFLSAPFVAGISPVYFHASACECLALE
jgi:hypothetical protein